MGDKYFTKTRLRPIMTLTIDSAMAKQIEKFYIEILDRKPNSSDLKNYLELIESGKIHFTDIPLLMKKSEEFKITQHMKGIGKEPIRTKDNIMMYLNPKDKAVSYFLSKENVWEPFETEIMKKFFKSNTVFIDIGAHIGYYSLLCASIAKQGKVFAFEPVKENFEILKKNAQVNNFKNIIISENAISDTDSSKLLYLSNENNTGDNRFFSDNFREIPENRLELKVKCVTLDQFLVDYNIKPNIIKMDIQGAELLALKGMKKTLDNITKLVVFTEFWPRGIVANSGSPLGFLDLLSHHGFEIYEINSVQKKILKKSTKQLVEENNDESNPEKQTDLICLKGLKLPNINDIC